MISELVPTCCPACHREDSVRYHETCYPWIWYIKERSTYKYFEIHYKKKNINKVHVLLIQYMLLRYMEWPANDKYNMTENWASDIGSGLFWYYEFVWNFYMGRNTGEGHVAQNRFLVNYLSIPVTRAWHPTTVCFSPSSKVSVSCRVTLQDQSSVNGKTVPTNTQSFLLTQCRLCTCHVVLMTVITWNRSMLISHSWFVALRELAATYIIASRFLAKFITVISVTRRFAWLTTTNAIYLP